MTSHRISQTTLTSMISAGLAVATIQPSNAATLYSALDLSSLGVTNITVTGINNLGQVVGSSYSSRIEGGVLSGGIIGSFRTTPNSPINSATDYIDRNLTNNVNSSYLLSNVANINDSGQVVGQTIYYVGFRTDPNSPINPATDIFNNVGIFSSANSINNSGQVVISQSYKFTGTQSFRTAPNSPVNLATDNIGALGGGLSVFPNLPEDTNPPKATETTAHDINDLGQVVGSSLNTSLQTHAFRTAPNSTINPLTDDLGTLGGSDSSAYAINNFGQVVGASTTANGESHAFRTAPNSAINPVTDDLGTLGGSGSFAYDINDLGQVVGYSTIASGETRAFLYDDGQLFDLNNLITTNLGVTLNYARGINNSGQIIAGTRSNGSPSIERAFLLTPIVSTAPAVPEPSFGLGLLALAALASIGIRRRDFRFGTILYK